VADDLDIALEVAPGRVGLNSFTVALAANGKPVEADEVSLLFTPVTAGLPPSEVQLEAAGDGLYRVEGGYLAMPDAWQVQTAVRRADHYDTFANFNISVGTNTAVSSIRWHRINGGLLLAAGLVLLISGWGGVWPWRAQTGQLTAVLLAAVGIIAFFHPPIVDENVILPNPIPPNADSIAAGKVLYLENCVPCHGLTGQGDGPVGITLNPRPADLTQHTAPGVHPDGRLYNWITDGVEGSVMPAFGNALSDEERWHVVNYIRTLNQP
jgi:mono/diheme cytochrome c family protein